MAGRKLIAHSSLLTALCSRLTAHCSKLFPLNRGIEGVFSLLMLSCDSIDCTLYNSVDMFCNLYQDGKPASLADTLTITAAGTDSVLLNRKVGAYKFQLPLSYHGDTDSIVLTVRGKDYEVADTIFVTKTNMVHFESPDCPATMFHKITSVSCTHEFIQSVVVVSEDINYARTENIQIHLHPAP